MLEKEKLLEMSEERDSSYLALYLKELAGIAKEQPGELQHLYAQLREEESRKRLTELWLSRVVELARGYQNQGVFMEDLIQEGNIGLLSGLAALTEAEEQLDAEEYLKESVCRFMEQVVNEAMNEADLENAVLAKTSLLSEAAKTLAEDMGRVATIEELSEYTRLPVEEIEDILNLSLDAVKLGEGEVHSRHC